MQFSKLSFLLVLFFAFTSNAQQVHTVGAMNELGKTNYKTQVWLDTIPDKTNLYGMGPYDRMKGEIMVFDGKPFYVSAFEDNKAVVSQSWNIRSPFFVYANVADWTPFTLSGNFTSVEDIQNKVADIAQKNGYNLKEAFPFKLIGSFSNITTHIVTPRTEDVEGYRPNIKQQLFSFNTTEGSLLGFYSENHQGIFTSSKSFVHVHYLSKDQTFMGHLDKINTDATSLTLYLPLKQKTSLKVNDTDFSKGRLGNIQEVDLNDLAKFHGHLCDGLVVGHLALKQALLTLYPDGTIDRTNTRIVSNPSPCLTDAAIYLTGGRYQFNSFYVSENVEGLFTLQRIDNGKTVSVSLNKDIKPEEINTLGAKAVKGELSSCQLNDLKAMEDSFSSKLLSENPQNNFTVTEISNFDWKPVLKNDYIKTDILNKNKANCSQ